MDRAPGKFAAPCIFDQVHLSVAHQFDGKIPEIARRAGVSGIFFAILAEWELPVLFLIDNLHGS
ncbi:hypothetical protein LFL97_26690 [Burkholderia sp. JSH-S8]|nr:hypothetical protein LFL97_26690 [Burkholderia sp. JSH-S8]